MPKVIELTIELNVQSVSCPGVWLCQDGSVSLTIFTLGTSYQTCMLPPIFPLMFKDVFYFRKRFENMCTFNNICCILKNETIYCELAQWSENCSNQCTILAQYLGSLNQVLFPPNTCSSDGVDLLMRRSKQFPVRIDEVWSRPNNMPPSRLKPKCSCPPTDEPRQRPVCHSARYHRQKCLGVKPLEPACRSRSQSTGEAKSCCSLKDTKQVQVCRCVEKENNPYSNYSRRAMTGQNELNVYNVETPDIVQGWNKAVEGQDLESLYCDEDVEIIHDDSKRCPGSITEMTSIYETRSNNKIVVDSMYVDCDTEEKYKPKHTFKHYHSKTEPCICEICERYHQLFHA